MESEYLNIYNNLIKLTRNKSLYQNTNIDENFSIRLTFFLLHFAFFLKNFKTKENKKLLQDLYDYIFRQLELSIREIGYGDQSINKKMKDYINVFFSILDKINDWNNLDNKKKTEILGFYYKLKDNHQEIVNYFNENPKEEELPVVFIILKFYQYILIIIGLIFGYVFSKKIKNDGS